jgi:hypothetical protein
MTRTKKKYVKHFKVHKNGTVTVLRHVSDVATPVKECKEKILRTRKHRNAEEIKYISSRTAKSLEEIHRWL